MRREPDRVLVAWLDGQPAESIWTTAITVFEVRTGMELLEAGRRRTMLEEAFEKLLTHELEGRVQPFDETAALAAGTIAATRQKAGRTIEIRDAEIAGIAMARKAALATRNVRHFADLNLSVIDPWAPSAGMRKP